MKKMENNCLKSRKQRAYFAQDEIAEAYKELDNLHVAVKTQILDEPDYIVILIHETILDTKSGKADLKQIYRKKIYKSSLVD